MRALLALLPSLASASTIVGFEDITSYDPMTETPVAVASQPYPQYFNLTVNQPYYVYRIPGYAPQGNNLISGGPGASYEFVAVSGISLLGVSVGGIEGTNPSDGEPYGPGTIVATLSLYGGVSGSSLLGVVNVGLPASATTPINFVFSDTTASPVTRFVLEDTLTPDVGGYAVDRIVLQASAVPEPSTYGLMAGGLALAAVALRRRRQVRS